MKETVDYIKYHGVITSVRNNVDKDYIWFDICQKDEYKDKNGVDRNNLSFFSARIYIEYSYKIDLRVGKDVYVQGIPKGYIDKNGRRQNYIHVLDINGLEVNKEPPLYRDGYWNGEKIPTEIEPIDDEEFLNEWNEFIESLDKGRF
jgi:hypothetical protein